MAVQNACAKKLVLGSWTWSVGRTTWHIPTHVNWEERPANRWRRSALWATESAVSWANGKLVLWWWWWWWWSIDDYDDQWWWLWWSMMMMTMINDDDYDDQWRWLWWSMMMMMMINDDDDDQWWWSMMMISSFSSNSRPSSRSDNCNNETSAQV